MNIKDTFREKMESQLREWKTKVETLDEKTIEELRRKNEALKEKWNTLQKESGAAWNTMKGGAEKKASEVKEAVDKIITRFK